MTTEKQCFTVMLEDKFNGGHYLVIVGAGHPAEALSCATSHMSTYRGLRLSHLVTFAGLLAPLVVGVPAETVVLDTAREFGAAQGQRPGHEIGLAANPADIENKALEAA